MNSKRRKTILRENNIFGILKSLSCLPNQKKLPPYSFIYWKSAPSVKNTSVRNILITESDGLVTDQMDESSDGISYRKCILETSIGYGW